MRAAEDPAGLPLSAARALMQGTLAELARAGDLVYADLRFLAEDRERLLLRNLHLELANRSRFSGFAVRVLAAGGWGFSCTSEADPAALMAAATRALSVARASGAASVGTVHWQQREAFCGRYESPPGLDPIAVPLDRKIADLVAATEPLLPTVSSGKGLRIAEGRGDFARRRQLFLSTEGSDIEQRFAYVSQSIVAHAVADDGRTQRRSYPSAMDSGAQQGGYERLAALRLREHAPRIRQEALELLDAPPLPAGRRDVILASDQLALQIHESCGHPTELDRALGTEVSLAGGSFMKPDLLGALRYGSKQVHITADATVPGALGTFGFDDEGTPAQKVDLVRDGLFVGYLSSRETAAAIGAQPSGAMRADTYRRLPLIRMVNINLEPGAGSLDDLLADTDRGILFETNKSWSIDDLRLHFQFGCEAAWEVRGGRRVGLYRDPVYSGTTPRFWAGCDAVAGADEFRMWGLSNCGKGEPMQLMRVGHGTAPARFRDVEVGHG